MHIHFIGAGNPLIGYGVHAINTNRHLQHLCKLTSIGYTATELRNFRQAAHISSEIAKSTNESEIINLCIAQGKSASNVFKNLKGRHAIFTVFESSILPDGWKESLETADLVITASQWGAEILRNSLNQIPVEVVPEGLDINHFHHWNRTAPASTAASRRRNEEFYFLSVGKLEDRKGIKELLEAFSIEFSKEKHVKLRLKIHNALDRNYLQRFQSMLPEAISDQVTLIKSDSNQDAMSISELANLYKSSHCFVFPSKAEGWGLPLLEAIACGTPYIATHYSGQTEYLNLINQQYSKIKYEMEEIRSTDFFKFHEFTTDIRPQWARPSIQSLAKNMRDVYSNWEQLEQETITNSQKVRNLFSWRASTEALLDTLLKHFS